MRGVRAAVYETTSSSAGKTCRQILSVLAEEGFVHHADGQWNWTNESYPADAVSLRSVSSDNFVVVDMTNGERVIGETDFTSGPSTLHEKAIYIVEGQLFQVERLDFDGRKAFVRAVDCDYYTDAITYTKVTILDTFAGDQEPGTSDHEGSAEAGAEFLIPSPRVPSPRLRQGYGGQAEPDPGPRRRRSHGEVHVVSRVVGFKKIKFYTNENVGSGELDLPEQQMHTSSYWLTIPSAVMASLPFAGDDRRDGVVGLAFAMKNIAQLLLMCDGHDIGLSVDGGSLDRSTRTGGLGGVPEALAAEPNVFIYDNYPGGIGFSRPLYEMHALLLERTRELIAGCPCDRAVRRASGPRAIPGPHAKQVASRILDRLARRRRASDVDLSSRLRAIVRPAQWRRQWRHDAGTTSGGSRELTYEPDRRVRSARSTWRASARSSAAARSRRPFGQCLVIDRRYEADRWHGASRIGDCELDDDDAPAPARSASLSARQTGQSRTIFIDLETTGLSGGAGTVAFLVGLRLLRSRRVSGAAVPAHQLRRRARAARRGRRVLRRRGPDRHLQRQDVRRAGDGDALAVSPAADAARRRAALRHAASGAAAVACARAGRRGVDETAAAGCRRSSACCSTSRASATCAGSRSRRASSVLRSGDPRPLEPVLEHNRLDLVSLAAVMARACASRATGADACRDGAEALALGRVYERARRCSIARSACYARAAEADRGTGREGEALYRLALRCRRERRFAEAAAAGGEFVELTEPRAAARDRAAVSAAAVRGRSARDPSRASRPRSGRPRASWRCLRWRKLEARGEPTDAPTAMRHRLARLESRKNRRAYRAARAASPLSW